MTYLCFHVRATRGQKHNNQDTTRANKTRTQGFCDTASAVTRSEPNSAEVKTEFDPFQNLLEDFKKQQRVFPCRLKPHTWLLAQCGRAQHVDVCRASWVQRGRERGAKQEEVWNKWGSDQKMQMKVRTDPSLIFICLHASYFSVLTSLSNMLDFQPVECQRLSSLESKWCSDIKHI